MLSRRGEAPLGRLSIAAAAGRHAVLKCAGAQNRRARERKVAQWLKTLHQKRLPNMNAS